MKKQNKEREYLPKIKVVKEIWEIIKPSKVVYSIGIILFSMHKFIENILYGLIYASVASISTSSNMNIIFGKSSAIFIGLIILSSITYIGEVMINKGALNISRTLSEQVVNKLSLTPIQNWYKKHSSYWMNLLAVDIDIINNMFTERFVIMSQNIISAIFGLIYVWIISPQMAIFALVAGGFYIFAATYFKSQTKDMQKRMRKKEDFCSEVYEEAIHSYPEIKFYRQISKLFKKKLDKSNSDYKQEGDKYTDLHTKSVTFKNLGYSISYLGALIWGLILVKTGRMELENMLAIWPVSVGISYAIQSFGMQRIVVQKNLISLERIVDLLKQDNEVSGIKNNLPILDEKPIIEFRNVYFNYSEDKNILKNISFSIKKGDKVAILGSSGCGKTTILKLLLKLYDVNQGDIYIYGENIKNCNHNWLRQQFSYFPQEIKLINDTLSENLRLVLPNASDKAIENALKQAYVNGFGVSKNGIEKKLGETGKELSGGQRQRVGLARCYLRDACIYIMDEMTAALDISLEKAISKEIMSNNDRTVIIVTHNKEVADLADYTININSHGELAS